MAHKLPSKPKKPKASATLKVWENFNKRVAEWKKKCTAITSAKKKKENLMKKLSK